MFQNADAIISQIDPSGAGLLSFSSFCKGVATLTGTAEGQGVDDMETEEGPKSKFLVSLFVGHNPRYGVVCGLMIFPDIISILDNNLSKVFRSCFIEIYVLLIKVTLVCYSVSPHRE